MRVILLYASALLRAAACGLMLITPVFAQSPSPSDLNAIIKQQQSIQRYQGKLRREQEHRTKEGRGRIGAAPFTLPPAPTEKESNACVTVNRIVFEGATYLSAAMLEDLAHPYRGRCLTLAEFNTLLRAISQAYVDEGYVTARPYLPQQDLNNGILIIVIVEGKVEAIEPGGTDWARNAELDTAFPGRDGDILNLRDLEQGLDQINRLRSNRATMALQPGSQPGATRVVVKNQPDKRWRVSAGLNNSGQASTGRHKYQTNVEFDNSLGLNDFLSLTTDHSAHYNADWRASRSVNGFASIPYGYWTLTVSSNYSDYAAPLSGTNQIYHSTGNSRTRTVELERVLHRDADSKTSAKGMFHYYSTNAYFNDQRLETSSYSLAVGGLGFGHSRRLLGGVFSAQGTWERGLDLLQVRADAPGLAKDSPHAQFDKVTADVSYLQPIDLGGLSLTYTGSAHGQWSETTLYSPERISLGGRYSVCGFDADDISGDTGLYVRNEVSLPLPKTGEAFIDDGLGRITPFLAYDYGVLRNDPKDEKERGVMTGWATGVRVSGDYLRLSLAYAQPLRSPAFITQRDREVYLSLAVQY